MTSILWPVAVPILAGLLAYCVPRAAGAVARWLAVLAAAATLALGIAAVAPLYGGGPDAVWTADGVEWLHLDKLGGAILVGVAFFGLLMIAYAAGFFKPGDVSESSFYANLLLSVGAGCGIVVAGHLILLAVFWGLMGIPLYLLVNSKHSEANNAAAKKTLLILGGTDSVLLLGIAAFIVSIGGDVAGATLFRGSPAPVAGAAAWISVICLLIAALAKAGAMPFHSWVPDVAEAAPVPAVALLPASLDKLLGIYLFARVFHTMYQIPGGLRVACLLVGAGTIVFAVMNAMVQHNLRRLLGFHAVSQVGYMIVGIATGTAIGLVGGLFHMWNNAIYKSCLFLTAGAAERKTGETELDRMGGLATVLPLTFVAAVVSALAISGVPPLNGFASKWMVYNGILASGESLGAIWVPVLVAAMFGSALTLASFVKVLHSVFLGQPKTPRVEGENPGALMQGPMLVLAALSVLLGVFAVRLGVNRLVLPGLGAETAAGFDETLHGAWSSGTATLMLAVALVVGGGICFWMLLFKGRAIREDEMYVGGETGARAEEYDFEGVEFYKTIRCLPLLRPLYRQAEARWYDLYEQLRRATFYVTGWLRRLHDGMLHSYATWCIVGLIVILWVLLSTYKVLGRAF